LQVITLGGLAALQNSCGSDNIVNNPAVASNLATGVGCGKEHFLGVMLLRFSEATACVGIHVSLLSGFFTHADRYDVHLLVSVFHQMSSGSLNNADRQGVSDEIPCAKRPQIAWMFSGVSIFRLWCCLNLTLLKNV
jgi:hypothetical protein